MQAILRTVRVSPQKANLVAALVRSKKVNDAVDILNFTPKKTAIILKKLIESAMANAENNFKQDKENLYIKEIIITQGPTYKRRITISRGRAHPILKRTSHIRVELAGTEAKTEASDLKQKTTESAAESAKPSKSTKST